MLRKLAKLRTLTWPEKHLLLTAWLLMPLFWLGLRLLGLQRFQAWLDRPPLNPVIARSEATRQSSNQPASTTPCNAKWHRGG